MEFGGPGLASLSPDERATLANMATECSAKAGVCEADEATLRVDRRAPARASTSTRCARKRGRARSRRATTRAACTRSTSRAIRPMVATPGDPAQRHPVRPDQRRPRSPSSARCAIDIAYGGSCTAGKEADLDMYAAVMKEALDAGPRGARTASTSSSSSAPQAVEAVRARRGLPRRLRADRACEVIHARLRRLHRLRARASRRAPTR